MSAGCRTGAPAPPSGVPTRSFQILYAAGSEDALRTFPPERRQVLEDTLTRLARHTVALRDAQPGWLRAAVAQRPALELPFFGHRVVYAVDPEARTIRVEGIEPVAEAGHHPPGR